MKIVILDGYTSNPGDLSWNELEKLGELNVYNRTPPQKTAERIRKADIVLTSKAPLDAETLSSAPELKYIGVLGTGSDNIDIEAAGKKGIVVSNVRNYTGSSSAQAVFAMILELTNRVGYHSTTVFHHKWSEAKDFCYWDFPLIELEGKTIGIFGYGDIGKNVARIALAFGMRVLIHTRSRPDNLPQNIKYTDLDDLFARSDVVSLHCPLTPQTEGLINADRLKQMKPSVFLINISRGGLIVEQDLADALNENIIAGAALDVLVNEPPGTDCPLLFAKNCYITPHIAWATRASRRRLIKAVTENVKAFIKGTPQNVVS